MTQVAVARRSALGVVMVLASAAAYATLPALVKFTYEHGANAAGVLALRFAFAAPIVVAWAALRRTGKSIRGAMSGFALPALLYFLQTLAFFESLARMSAVLAVVALFSYPLMVAAGDAIFFGERMTRGRAGLILVGSAGVVLSVGLGGKADFWGLVLALVSAVLFAAFFLMAKKRQSEGDLDGITLTAVTYIVCGFGFPVVAVAGGAAAPSDMDGWLAVAVIVVVGTVFAAVLLYSGLRHLPAGTASMLSAAEPPLAVALAAVLLGEHVAPTQVLGMALVVASLGALSYSVTRPATAGPAGEMPAA